MDILKNINSIGEKFLYRCLELEEIDLICLENTEYINEICGIVSVCDMQYLYELNISYNKAFNKIFKCDNLQKRMVDYWNW